MTATQEEPATFEKVWAALMETRQQMAETDRRQAEAAREIKETAREFKEMTKETNRQMKATDKQIGKLGNRLGDMVESMVIPNLVSRFNELGFTFKEAGKKKIEDAEHGMFFEIDAYLENNDYAMVVETKVNPNQDDVDYHINRMEKIRRYADLNTIKRQYYGAIAGAVMSKEVKAYILAHGLYAIEPSGETFTITAPEGPGEPRVW
jgi:hypothetical protein